ncbi:MAG TPA: nucleotidyltransferase family protein [Steroidobacteraceae bacterium]|jgi:hypothetical protein|nr:nucleotidyltransferase family protein [Steroidobacteraceae bacterium]
MNVSLTLELENVVAELCALEKALRQRGLTSLALFGSVVRGTARPDSDIDVLIDVSPGERFSLVDLVAVKDFLEDQLGRPVDVVTRAGLDPAIRDRVLIEAQAVF